MGIDRDDPRAVPLHVSRNGVGGLGRCGACSDNRDGGIRGEDLFDDVIGVGHDFLTVALGIKAPPVRFTAYGNVGRHPIPS